MIIPTKSLRLSESVIGKFHLVLDELKSPISLKVLESKCSRHFDTIEDFVLTLDALYALKVIAIDFKTGVIEKC